MDRILSSFAVHSANSSSVLEVRQLSISEQLFLKRRQLSSYNQMKNRRTVAYHLGSSFGWSLTGGTARARTEVAHTASPLRHTVSASTENQGGLGQELKILARQQQPW